METFEHMKEEKSGCSKPMVILHTVIWLCAQCWEVGRLLFRLSFIFICFISFLPNRIMYFMKLTKRFWLDVVFFLQMIILLSFRIKENWLFYGFPSPAAVFAGFFRLCVWCCMENAARLAAYCSIRIIVRTLSRRKNMRFALKKRRTIRWTKRWLSHPNTLLYVKCWQEEDEIDPKRNNGSHLSIWKKWTDEI